MKGGGNMNYQELCQKINSPTLQRDFQYFQEIGDCPIGYMPDELALMQEYLNA